MDRLTILVIICINSDLHSFSSEVGIGSNMHVLDGDFKTTFWISSTDTGVNCDSLDIIKSLMLYLSKPLDVPKLSLILSIFSTKTAQNSPLILPWSHVQAMVIP